MEKSIEVSNVAFDKEGLVVFDSNVELARAAALLKKINLAPDHLKTVEQVATALIFCQQHRLPYSAMNEIGVIKGKAGAYGSLVTALAQRDPEFGELVVLYVNSESTTICHDNKNLSDEVYACVIKSKKKNSDIWKEYFFTLDEAKKAGLLGNDTYKKYLKDMLFHRAKFRCLKTEYAGSLNGVDSFEIMLQEEEVRELSPREEYEREREVVGVES